MSAFARQEIVVNVDTRKQIRSTTRIEDPDIDSRTQWYYGEKRILCISFVDASGTAYPLDAGDTFDLGIDNDFDHTLDSGTASAGYTGAIAAVSVAGLSATIPATGHLVLVNGAGESDRIAYTAVTGSSPWVFTVSDTLTYTYLLGDTVRIEDELMAYSADSQVDIAGDWADIDRATGKISIRVNCLTDAFNTKVAAADTDGDGEITTNFQIRRVPAGETQSTTMVQDWGYAFNSIISTEGQPGETVATYLTRTSADARYLQVYGNYSDIGAALVDTDVINVYDIGTATVVKSNMSRVLTYISTGAGLSALTNANRIVGVASAGVVKELTIAEGSITGLLTISKTGTTARTVTYPDRALTVAGTGAATTSGTISKFDASGDLTDSLIIDNIGTGAITFVKTGTTARTVTFPDIAGTAVLGPMSTQYLIPVVGASAGLLAESTWSINGSTMTTPATAGITAATALTLTATTGSIIATPGTALLVGVGTQYASEKLGVNGDVYVNGGATFAGNVTSTGIVYPQNGLVSQVFGADINATTLTDATRKTSRIGARHYTLAEEPVSLFFIDSESTTSKLYIGGGTTLMNAVSEISFYTASDNVTVSGSRVATMTSTGALLIGTTSQYASEKLGVNGSIYASLDDASTNTVLTVDTIRRTSSGAPVAGIGASRAWVVETASANYETGLTVAAVCTDVTGGAEDFDTVWSLMEGGAAVAERMRLSSSGNLTVYQANAAGAVPTLTLSQVDVDEPFMKVIGTADASNVTNSIVPVANVATATVAGYVKIEVQDDGNQITDQDYYIEIKTLT